jgi:hypothetical protein
MCAEGRVLGCVGCRTGSGEEREVGQGKPSSSGARSRLVGLHAAGQTDSARLRAAS